MTFRHHWRNAIVAELLFTAAHHYVRNKMQAQSAGLAVDDKAKDKDYLARLGGESTPSLWDRYQSVQSSSSGKSGST